ncbi:growth-regulating factor 3 isoform X1 [Solanum stenotomum]|uniref:growth-regulating factor 3 isoform X1 n=1 Tax=Solanum stenotomum TaxID=172797 RepID=UPI0020D0BF99|nr:growth-regulating factor 3 isoform X1 [Solanum stenotomum]
MMGHHQDLHCSSSSDGGANKMPFSSNEASLLPPAPPPPSAAVVRSLQPFDVATNSQGGMATALGYPFTWAQWKELERQAMIYKYMVSAISVPPDLLLSICSGASHTTSATGSVQGQRYTTNIRDLEPGRCKRTDGKKWRCSRDVAPHQKYCERHMHRGRPRSRKHVEVHAGVSNASDNKKTRLQVESTAMAVTIPTTPASQINNRSTKQPLRSTFQQIQSPLFFHDDKIGGNGNISTDPSFNELHRSSGWMMEGELVAKADSGQQWQHLMDSNAGYSAHGYREEALNFLASRDLERTEHTGEFNFMTNPEFVKDTSRDLINGWSNDNVYNNSNNENMEALLWPSLGNISPSSLTLSIAMAAGDVLDEDMGLDSRFMNTNQHNFWENSFPFASGGPLAEVLHPSSSFSLGDNPTSSYTSNGDSISPAATTVSSPSGVLQKTVFSHSDGSVCNSPILAAPSNITPETVQFQWLR